MFFSYYTLVAELCDFARGNSNSISSKVKKLPQPTLIIMNKLFAFIAPAVLLKKQ